MAHDAQPRHFGNQPAQDGEAVVAAAVIDIDDLADRLAGGGRLDLGNQRRQVVASLSTGTITEISGAGGALPVRLSRAVIEVGARHRLRPKSDGDVR